MLKHMIICIIHIFAPSVVFMKEILLSSPAAMKYDLLNMFLGSQN